MTEGCYKAEEVISQVLRKNHLDDLLYFAKIRKSWAEIVGKPLSHKTRPQSLKKGVLTILTEDAAYAQHLSYYNKSILELIASDGLCGPGIVKRVKFIYGRLPPLPLQSPEPQNPRPRPLLRDEAYAQADAASQGLRDKNLKKAFSNAMAQFLRKTHA